MEPKIDSTPYHFKRKHLRRSKFTKHPKGIHPETAVRMEQKCLTAEEMKLANDRRQLLRQRHIWRVYEALKKVRVGYISLAEIANAAKSDWRTVKEALGKSFTQIALQLREAFKNCVISLSKDINILSSRFASQQKNSSQGVDNSRWKQKIFDRCRALAETAAEEPEECAPAPLTIPKYDPAGIRPGEPSVKMRPIEAKAWLRQKEMPHGWRLFKEGLDNRLKLKQNGFKFEKKEKKMSEPVLVRGQSSQRVIAPRPQVMSEREKELMQEAIKYQKEIDEMKKKNRMVAETSG